MINSLIFALFCKLIHFYFAYSGKPVLILANKQDLKGAMDDLDIVERLNIETIVNRFIFHYDEIYNYIFQK